MGHVLEFWRELGRRSLAQRWQVEGLQVAGLSTSGDILKASEKLLSLLNTLDHSREVPINPQDLFQECHDKEVRKA